VARDDEIDEQYRQDMANVMHALDDVFNQGLRGDKRKVGLVLLVFPFGGDPEGRCNYISNGASREDIATMFKELVSRFEGQPEMKGHA